MPPRPTDRFNRQYEVVIRQQPVRARMCGFSDTKDRRLIDPPPILQLFAKENGKRVHPSPLECVMLVCHASLWSPNGKEERNIVVNPRGHGDDEAAAAQAAQHAAQKSREAAAAAAAAYGYSGAYGYPGSYYGAGYPPYYSGYPGYGYPGGGGMEYPGTPTGKKEGGEGGGKGSKGANGGSGSGNGGGANGGSGAATGPTTLSCSEALAQGLFASGRLCQTLLGSLAVPCSILQDVDGTEGAFFVFHDLSVRAQGTYRLKFQVMEADPTVGLSGARATAWTNVFEVFSPKVFPGMT
ncbi:hypothetical protein HDU96_009545, partial [Phlyctochytrium bullatum]